MFSAFGEQAHSFATETLGLSLLLGGGEDDELERQRLEKDFARKSRETQAAAKRKAQDKTHGSKPDQGETEMARLERIRMAKDKVSKGLALKDRERQERKERRAEEKRKAEEAEAKEIQRIEALHSKVEAWLQERGIADVTTKRKSWFSSCYALHVAVKEKNSDMIQCLLATGADPTAKNSSGQTPQQLARRLDRSGSHAALAEVFAKAETEAALAKAREVRRRARREAREALRAEEIRIGYVVGEGVDYCSTTARKWIPSEVVRKLPTGNYDLDCKKDVRTDRIRRGRAPAGRPGSERTSPSSSGTAMGSMGSMSEAGSSATVMPERSRSGDSNGALSSRSTSSVGKSPWATKEGARTAYDISHMDLRPAVALPAAHNLPIGEAKRTNRSVSWDPEIESLDSSEEAGVRFSTDSEDEGEGGGGEASTTERRLAREDTDPTQRERKDLALRVVGVVATETEEVTEI